MLGYDISFTENLHFKVEAYYQHLYNIPIGYTPEDDNDQFSVINVRYGFVTIPLTNKGTGTNVGVDLTFENISLRNIISYIKFLVRFAVHTLQWQYI